MTDKCSRGLVAFTLYALALLRPIDAQPVLSGMTGWLALPDGGTYHASLGWWDTLGGDYTQNIFFFTGPATNPNFLTFGDTVLNPNFALLPGTTTIGFAGQRGGSGDFGINLYFDGDVSTNRISALLPAGGGGFRSLGSDVTTSGQGLHVYQPGAGTLSYTSNGYLVTLTGFTFEEWGPIEHDFDGMLTFSVSAVPEPAEWSAVGGICVLALVVLTKRSRSFCDRASLADLQN